MRSLPSLQTRSARRGSVRPAALPQHRAIPALRWWRKRNVARIARNGMEELRAALSLTTRPSRPNWRTAARGDDATAIRLNFMILASAPPSAWAVDLAASALPFRAADGTAAARPVPKYCSRRFVTPDSSSRHGEA